MAKSADIWFPFYVGDYIADTMHLSAEEHGAYLLLIIHYWKTQNAIKNDKKTLKNISKINSKKLQNVLSFFQEKDGYFFHKRIEEEIAKAKAKSDAARKSAEARWAVEGDANAYPNAPADAYADSDANAMRIECSSQSQSHKYDDDDSVRENFVDISLEIQKLMKGRILNTQIVHSWIKGGADKDLIIETLKVCLSKKGGEPPNSLKYFDGAVADAVRLKNQPMETENAGIQPNSRKSGSSNYKPKRSITEITNDIFAKIDAGTF